MAPRIFPADLGIHSAITPDMIPPDGTARATVGVLLIDRGNVLLAKSGKAPDRMNWWTLPQEGVEYTDGNIGGTITRGLRQELGLLDHHYDMRTVRRLMFFQNRMPSERSNGEKGYPDVKEIVYFGINLKAGGLNAIRPDRREVIEVMLAPDWKQVDDAMATVAEHRVHKYIATCLAIRAACRAKMLSWNVPAFMDARLKTHSAQLAH